MGRRISVAVLTVWVLAGCGAASSAGASLSASPHSRVAAIAKSDPCTPQPCALVDGLEIVISNIQYNAPVPPNDPPSPAGTHYVRLDVSFIDIARTHTVRDPYAAMPILIDEYGPNSMTTGAPGVSVSYKMANPDAFCGPAPTPSAAAGGSLGGNIAPPLATLSPGQHAGPVHMCFWVMGSTSQRLTYAWWPSIVPDTPGVVYEPVMIPLPRQLD